MKLSLFQSNRAVTALFLAIVAAGGLLRLLPLSSELWLDELWSWEFARAATSPLQIWTGPNHHHDNNHKLNTLVLYYLPDGVPYAYYRLHSLASGVLAVILAWMAARRRGVLEAAIAAVLFAVQSWFALCSAEARGYAMAIALALAAYLALRRYLDRGGWSPLILFWLSVILGFSAHLTFLHVYLALGVWSVYRFARKRESSGSEIVQLVRCHGVPAAFFVLLYLTDLRGMELGGGPIIAPQEVVGSLLARGLGLPFSPETAWISWALLLGGLAITAFGLWLLRQEGSDEWVFFAMAIVGAPLIVVFKALVSPGPTFLYERYFFIPFAFFLLLLAHVLAIAARRSVLDKVLVTAALLFVFSSNVLRVWEFAESGRGAFREVLAYMDRETPAGEPDIVLAGDHDFRVSKFVHFYGRYSGATRPFVYKRAPMDEAACLVLGPASGANAMSAEGVTWLLVHRPDGGEPPSESVTDLFGNEYEQAKAFRAAKFGGWDWYVYRRAGRSDSTTSPPNGLGDTNTRRH